MIRNICITLKSMSWADGHEEAFVMMANWIRDQIRPHINSDRIRGISSSGLCPHCREGGKAEQCGDGEFGTGKVHSRSRATIAGGVLST